MKPHPRPPISPRLSARLRALEYELLSVWGEYEGLEPYSEEWNSLLWKVHDLRLAVYDTLRAIEMHKGRRRGRI